MSADTYTTIASEASAVYREKMSRFLAFAHPVASASEVKEKVAEYRKKYYDARHVCWAYVLGADRKTFQSNDDGEPSGTAGRPILGQINSAELSNVLVVVVRYFGGIKLGTSGLISAYKEATRMVLDEAEKVERHEETLISFVFPYLSMNSVMKLVKNSGARIKSQDFNNSCVMEIIIRSDNAEALRRGLSDIDGVSVHE
ncbi:MAG: YigZ family protein [Muribaculaceae bacterium]|nr:YigZ family protein [Muribaculaceae bacterium]